MRNDLFSPKKPIKFNPIGKSRLDVSIHKVNQKIGKDLIDRLFYGKSKNLPERRLSPKVKFAKKKPEGYYTERPSYLITDSSYPESRIIKKYKLKLERKEEIKEPEFLNCLKTLANYNIRYKD